MPHAAFYVVQHTPEELIPVFSKVSMPHAAFYVVQPSSAGITLPRYCFNAARSILCGATSKRRNLKWQRWCFNAARSILCGATFMSKWWFSPNGFQCRTQHYMWCNLDVGQDVVQHEVSMPHAALYVVQPSLTEQKRALFSFQCRTQHYMWCN